MGIFLIVIAFFLLVGTIAAEYLLAMKDPLLRSEKASGNIWRGYSASALFFIAAAMWWKL